MHAYVCKFEKLHFCHKIHTLVAKIYLHLCVFIGLIEVRNLLPVQKLKEVCKWLKKL